MPTGRILLALLFIAAGLNHFFAAGAYARIVPPLLPGPVALVYVSGVCEVLGGVGLLFPVTQRFAAWGLVALLVAVMPANIYMAIEHEHWRKIPEWALWLRLPLQIPMMWWAWLYTRRS